MGVDKRSVTTGAIETLGTIITDREKRDAIHVAVEPAIAAHTLRPGEDVGFVKQAFDGRTLAAASRVTEKLLGIVDPFLKQNVKPGERFWLLVYPRQITSLRHVWSHPDFGESEALPQKVESEGRNFDLSDPTEFPGLVAAPSKDMVDDAISGFKADSIAWLKNFASQTDLSYEAMMRCAVEWLVDGEYYTQSNSESMRSLMWDNQEEFWRHYDIVTDSKVGEDKRRNFFSCSC